MRLSRRQNDSLTLRIAGTGLFCFGVLLVLAAFCRAETISTTLVPALGWDVKKQGGFPVSLVADAGGNIWVGTEGNGLWRYDVAKKDWTQFTTKDGLGDDCVYALAVDQLGRIWAGHLNHGVSVYNGVTWKNYGLLDGPIGDRVFSIAVSPKDGDVWIATDMGLSRYSEKRQDWDYYTRASGLPSDQIQSLTFDDDMQLYAGTQCDGVAIAGPDDDYAKWHVVHAPANIPPAAGGDGLATDLVNDIHTVQAPSGKVSGILAVTPFGMEAKEAYGDDWRFARGQDWQSNTPGPYDNRESLGGLPASEDWMTVMGGTGTNVWVGYRRLGVESRVAGAQDAPHLLPYSKAPDGARTHFWLGDGGVDVRNMGEVSRIKANVEGPAVVLIRAFLPLPDRPPLFAAYDSASGGLLKLAKAPPGESTVITGTVSSPAGQASPPALPAAVPPPVAADVQPLFLSVAKLTQQLVAGEAYYLADDWRTEGDWIGRYGTGYVKLCGMAEGDQDYQLQPGYKVKLQVGPHHEENAAGPVSFHDDENSNDLRSLYDPTIGHRRDAEENDFSDNEKVYPETYDGPDLWVRVTVPESVHCLSLYFLNNDAHTVSNAKYRDYDVTIVPDFGDDDKIEAAAPLARTRVTDFWGGVYKQFMVCGPASYVVRIGRNRSFGTRLQAVFLDPVTGPLTDTPGQLPGFNTVPYSWPDEPDDYHPTPLTDAAVTLWSKLDDGLVLRGAIPLQMPLRIWCYRAAVTGGAPAAILEHWRWEISIWTPEDRKKFDDAMKAAYETIK